jgi:hypothetical protein
MSELSNKVEKGVDPVLLSPRVEAPVEGTIWYYFDFKDK